MRKTRNQFHVKMRSREPSEPWLESNLFVTLPILKHHGIPPAPERQTTTTWQEFIHTHMDVLVATDFFTAEVWTLGGLVTYYVLFFIHLGSRKIHVAGVTPHPHEAWMVQVARNVTMEEWGFLSAGQYLIHDRDGKYCPAFQRIIEDAGIKRVPLPARSPNLNAYAERWVRSVKEECLSRLILFGEASLRHALTQYVAHFHHERNHQGKGNVLLFPTAAKTQSVKVRCSVANGLGSSSNTTHAKPHEFFDHTGSVGAPPRQELLTETTRHLLRGDRGPRHIA